MRKKAISIMLTLVIALLLVACEGNAAQQTNKFLAALEKAAAGAGYHTDNSMSHPTNGAGKPVPVDGFCIAGKKGSKDLNVAVNQFTSAKDAKEVCDHLNSLKAMGFVLTSHAYKEFCVEFTGDDSNEAALMEVFKKAGWGK